MSAHAAIYGNTVMRREWCHACEGWALVVKGLLLCCDGKPSSEPIAEAKRMSDTEKMRRGPSAEEKREILASQDDRCLYCFQSFGSVVEREGKKYLLRLNWDHWIPYAYGQDNHDTNFVAACHVCNNLKSSRMFANVEEAREALIGLRAGAGWRF